MKSHYPHAPTPAGHKATHQPSQADLKRTQMVPDNLPNVELVQGRNGKYHFTNTLPQQKRSRRDRGIL